MQTGAKGGILVLAKAGTKWELLRYKLQVHTGDQSVLPLQGIASLH